MNHDRHSTSYYNITTEWTDTKGIGQNDCIHRKRQIEEWKNCPVLILGVILSKKRGKQVS